MESKNKSGKSLAVKPGWKVIHVYFIHSRKNFYFGSVKAIFQNFTEKELGVTYQTLSHRLVSDGSHHISQEALFIRSHLIRSSVSKEK